MGYGLFLRAAAASGALFAGCVGGEVLAADKVRITKLTDVSFGQIFTLSDISAAQNICVYSSATSGAYTVTASGDVGGAFLLTSGSNTLAYEVQWAQTSGQASGSPLQAGATSQIFYSQANNHQCNGGPATTATLIVRLTGAETANARAGNYSGTLTILIAPG